MAALGRILQIAGWLWLIGSFAGSILGLIGLNPLPGIVLVFVARVIRNQANTREMPDLGGQTEGGHQERSDTRTVEAPRRRQAPPSPEPYVLETPSRPEPVPETQSKPTPVHPRRDLLEEVVGPDADREVDAGEKTPMSSDQTADAGQRRPMTSAEMIARAHERWDSDRR